MKKLLLVFTLAACRQTPLGPETDAVSQQSALAGLEWIDTHVHLRSHLNIDDYIGYQQQAGMQRMVLLSPQNAGALAGERPNWNAEALLAKARYPDRFYFFGGLDLTPLATGGEPALKADLAAQVNGLADSGADGLKLYFRATVVEALKQVYGFDFLPDNPSLAPLFETAAARGLPVLIHIDSPYVANGKNAGALYPNIKWVVTHLGFEPDDAGKLSAFLDTHPNAWLDVGHFVHGGELIYQGRAAAIALVTKHSKRIFVSSDLASGCDDWGLDDDACPSSPMALQQIGKLRQMFETTQQISFVSAYNGQSVTVTGLGLPAAVLRGLYHDGALALLGAPRPQPCGPALAHVDRLIAHTTLASDVARLQDIRTQLAALCATP